MTEQLLRRHLKPIAARRRRLYLAWRMSICWLAAGLVGLGLLGVAWLWGWRSPFVVGGLAVVVSLVTIWIFKRSRRLEPDYQVLARTIEQQHPDLQALLLAAVEQEPAEPDGELGYLQKQVITEAVTHATSHNWLQSISSRRLMLAGFGRIAAMAFLLVVLLQMLPPTSLLPPSSMGVLVARDYDVVVTPGDTEVERGTPVVIIARFKGKMPSGADLVFGPSGQEPQRMPLTRSLEDPLFGGILQEVAADLRYHVAYGGKRTRDYTIAVFRNPELLRADARIVYPPYTKLPEKVIEDTRQINVVEGSKVELRFTLNKPVATARLVPKKGIALGLTLDPEDPNVLTTSLTATESERYELHMADAEGRPGKMPPRFAIEVHRNLPPELTPVFPARDVVVSPLEELALEAEVLDDYGVTAYGLTYAFAGRPSQDVVLDAGAVSNDKLKIQYLLAMEDLEAQPSQLMTYSFWADDVGSDGQPRRTASDIYFAEVRPFEEIFRESQSSQSQQDQQQQPENQDQQGQQADQLARLQKQIITATWNIKQQAEHSGGIDEHEGDLAVIQQSQAEVLQQTQGALAQAEGPSAAGALQAAAGHMETSLDHLSEATESSSTEELTPALGAEQLAYQELLKLRDREHQVTRGQSSRQSRQANSASARSEQQLQQLELTQRENRYETQRMAQSREQTARQENLQVLNRLRDLARRQNTMAERLKEAQAALQKARDEQERQQMLRELKRLRDEQLQALRDMDELQQRMESSQNRRQMADAREQLNDSRSEIRESAEALEEGRLSRAITSATRAQRQLEEMREEFQRRSSSQFADQMREMRDQARQLDERQGEIAEEIEQELEERQKSLSGANTNRRLAEEIDRQRERMEELIEQMKTVSEQAETTEPLVSRKLYDTLRQANAEDPDKALAATGELLRRNFLPQAQEIERRAAEGIGEVRKGVEEAAESVLGDEAESLRLAREQLDDLVRQVDEEARVRGQRAESEGSQPRQGSSGEPRDPGEETESGERAEARSEATGRPSAGRPPEDGQSERPQQAQQGGSPRDGTQRQTTERGGQRAGTAGRNDPQGWGGNRASPEFWDDTGARRPFTGEDYRQWSDRLRDVEEMLPEQELREDVARVRDRARAVRAEFVRHGKEPQWDLVRSQVMEPLTELRQRISERLAQLESDEAMVPIDRDPVPDRYAELVRTYFENLGQAESEVSGPGAVGNESPISIP